MLAKIGKTTLLFSIIFVSLLCLATNVHSICDLSNPKALLKRSKDEVRKYKNNTKAYACIVMAYDLLGNEYMAIKVLRDIEETFEQRLIDEIHDYLWRLSPELLAKKEFKDRRTMKEGDCIIKNTTVIDGNGYLLIGEFFVPSSNSIRRHLTSFRCNREFSICKHIDLTCPNCEIVNPQLVIKVSGYKIDELFTINPAILERNLRYIRKILQLQRDTYVR